ncbi:hypothetical protein KJ966_19390 [bacterium]|nr:hypothetical protein [bacterium]
MGTLATIAGSILAIKAPTLFFPLRFPPATYSTKKSPNSKILAIRNWIPKAKEFLPLLEPMLDVDIVI